MKTKYGQTELYVVCNIFGNVNALFDIYTDFIAADMFADSQNALHEDERTCYKVIDLYNYLDCIATRMTVLEAYNNYHKD